MENKLSPLKFFSILIDSFIISLQSSFYILFFAYIFGSIYLIGDSRELYPLLEGVIIGLVLFISAIIIIGNGTLGRIFSLIISGVLIIIAWYLSAYPYFNSPNFTLLVIGMSIMSPFLVISQYFLGYFSIRRRSLKAITLSLSSLIIIAIIIVFAELYERQGQILLPLRIEVLGALSILSALIILYIKRKEP